MTSIHNINTKFITTVDKLLFLTQTKIHDQELISNNLSDLNELDYRHLKISNNQAVMLLINQLFCISKPTEISLIQNTCELLINLLQNNFHIQERTFIACEKWVLETLKFSQTVTQNLLLLALKTLLTTGQFRNLHMLLGPKSLLSKYLDPKIKFWSESNVYALWCMEAIFRNNNYNSVTKDFIDTSKQLVTNIIFNLNRDVEYYNKTAILCIKILKLVALNSHLGELLGVVRAYLFHGINDYPPVEPEPVYPVAMNLPEQRIHTIPKCRNIKNSRKTKPMKKCLIDELKNSSETSDSDTSDGESNHSLNATDSKVRLEAIDLLQIILKNTDGREIFGYWPQIVASGTRNDARVLVRLLIKEPILEIRRTILNIITQLLLNAKPYLAHAEDDQQASSSFITFFATVGLMIKEIHSILSVALGFEKDVTVLTSTLKCTATLIQTTPYARLKTGLIKGLSDRCWPHIYHKDPTIRVAALSIFETLASHNSITQEIIDILSAESKPKPMSESVTTTNDETEEEIDLDDLNDMIIDETVNHESNKSTLVKICLQNIIDETTSTPVRLESLKLLRTLSYNVQLLIFDHLETITKLLISLVETKHTLIILYACRVLEIMAESLATNKDDIKLKIFWDIILEPISTLTQNHETVLREIACDCLGNIGADMLSQLTKEKIILIITILFGLVRDEESAVRAASLRALGMLVVLNPLKEDVGFLMDLSDLVCLGISDTNLGVRIKAAWTLANLSDSLAERKIGEETEPIPYEIILDKLHQVAIKASRDNDKVKCNAIRAVGCILKFCPERGILKDTCSGLEVLIDCAMKGKDMKVRWNACRAIGLVLSHDPDNILPLSWKDQVIPALCNLICYCPNFKVRTNAAWALSMYNCYGKYTSTLWKTMLLAFENSQHVPSYMEYSHQNALTQQLCLTLSQLAASIGIKELLNLWKEIEDSVDDISNFVKQFQGTVLPEKFGQLVEAKTHLDKLSQIACSEKEKQIARSLANIFNLEIGGGF